MRLWGNVKRSKTCVTKVPENPEHPEKEIGAEKVFDEIMLKRGERCIFTDPKRTPNKISSKKTVPRHIRIQLLKPKDKEKSFKAAREKWHKSYGETIIWITTAVTLETMKSTR